MSPAEGQYVSRSGHKLAHALREFAPHGVDPAGAVCIDLGSHTGGFVQCLLERGATRVYAVDPGRGVLHATLRGDPRVVACEGVNALDFTPPERADLVTIDVGWTPQRLILPVARRCLAQDGWVITLVKPHYEAPKPWLRRGVLPADRRDEALARCRDDVADLGWRIPVETRSPLPGHAGNEEWLWLLRP